MKRRSFIRHTTHALGVSALMGPMGLSSLAQSFLKSTAETNKVLVLIYLQGGNDGLNTVIPLDQLSALNKVRPHVFLPENKLLELNGTNVALHPSLQGFQTLFNEDRLRIIQSVGYPEPNYSHFRSTDIWMSASDSNELVNSGWTGRYLDSQYPGFPDGYPNDEFPHPLSVEIGYGSSLLFQGEQAAMSLVLKDPTNFYELVDNVEGELPNTHAGDKLRHLRLTAKQSQVYGEKVKLAAEKVRQQKEYPETDLAEQLKIVSRLIAGGLETPLYLVRIDGFDTHSDQVQNGDHTKGEHANILAELNDAVMAFMQDLEFLNIDDRVTGMTFSEFGRRIISNASNGTDHGAAAPMFVFGNNVVPGVLGNNPEISPEATWKDNLVWEFDFRQVYSSMLDQWFHLDASNRESVMFDDFNMVPIIKSGLTAVNHEILDKEFKVYPNPFQNQAQISYPSLGENIQINIVDINGRTVEQVFSGKAAPGQQALTWHTEHLLAGNYFVVFRGKGFKKALKVIKSN